MDENELRRLLEKVRAGKMRPDEAAERLRHLPISEIEGAQATLDTHRQLRTGLPEVVLGEGKRPDQVVAIVRRFVEVEQTVLVTRLSAEVGEQVLAEVSGGRYDPVSRTLVVRRGKMPKPRGKSVVVVTAGSSDAAVAEEAAVTAEVSGARVERIHDVGVAGVHRVLRHGKRLSEAGVLVVVAGMEGALPSVVAGLSGRPVIAVPTSVGYGAAFGGVAALLGMLTACAPGIAVVNIDNGFGAGQLAAKLAREMR
jgi:pyridinium-3,5-biscarboxylic acid mononucleotide synthase